MEYNRLKWASRRGMLELDLILQPFVENVYLSLEQENQQQFVQLLACEDQDLFAWLLHRERPEDNELQTIVDIIHEHTGKQP